MANRQRGAAPQVNAAFPHRPASPRSPGTAVRSGARAAQRKAKRGWDGTRMGDRREEVDGAAISPRLLFGVKQTAPPHNAAPPTTGKVGSAAPAALRRKGARLTPKPVQPRSENTR